MDVPEFKIKSLMLVKLRRAVSSNTGSTLTHPYFNYRLFVSVCSLSLFLSRALSLLQTVSPSLSKVIILDYKSRYHSPRQSRVWRVAAVLGGCRRRVNWNSKAAWLTYMMKLRYIYIRLGMRVGCLLTGNLEVCLRVHAYK